MTIDRRTFVAGATLFAFAPALEFLPAPLSPPGGTVGRLAFMIDGWNGPSEWNESDEIWITVNRSWHAAWR